MNNFPTHGGGNLGQIDTSSVEADNFEALPAGKYNVVITESEVKPNSKNTGQYLQLRMDVIDGKYKGRVLFDRLNLWNQNPVAVEIAMKALKAIEVALGYTNGVNDSAELHNKPLTAKVKYKPADGQYDEGNEIGGYMAMQAVGQSMPDQPVQQAQPQAQPAGAMPWQQQ